VSETFALRRYESSGRLIERPERLQSVLDVFAAAGPAGATPDEVATRLGMPGLLVGRLCLWLLKYHFLEEAGE
jgi:DNA-binding IclR family transcriptional regulator